MPGIGVDIKENGIGHHLLCIICRLLLRNPVQTVCGHRCCLSCVKEIKGSSDSFTCPEDGTIVTEVYPDRFVAREVSTLDVTCVNKHSGCTWKGLVKYLEEHLQSCHFAEIKCINSGCDAFVRRKSLERHLDTECRFTIVNCDACGETVPYQSLKEHQTTMCPFAKVKCGHCGKEVVRKQLQGHEQNDCSEAALMCPFVKIGCTAKQAMKKNDPHTKSDQVTHMDLLLDHVLEIENELLQLKAERHGREVEENMETDIDFATSIYQKNTIYENRTQLNPSTPNGLQRYINMKGNIVNDSSPMLVEPGAAGQFVSLPNQASNRQQANAQVFASMSYQIDNLESKVTAMRLTMEDVISGIQGRAGDPVRRIDAIRDSLRKLENRVANLETSEQMKAVNVAEQEDIISQLQDASYNGTLIWQIPNLMKERHDAIVGKKTSIYSAYFYTGRYGYKMRLRVYLNGDGSGKGSHISMFFVICKGKYDALLQWPFKQRVNMTLVDQDRVRDISDSFMPDPTSSSFQKPRNPMNIASGSALFMPISALDTHAYIVEDTLFIKAEVDTSGLNH